MALRDRDWPAYSQWFCCLSCHRLWTSQGGDVVVLREANALGPALPSPGVPERTCLPCAGLPASPLVEI